MTVPASVTKIGEKALGYLTSGKGGQAYKLEGFTIRGVAGSAAEMWMPTEKLVSETSV